MTDQQTDLSPRELDAALAEGLFGWRQVEDWQSTITNAVAPGLNGIAPATHTRKLVPDYSTTGDGMLKVLEAMRERFYSVEGHHFATAGCLARVVPSEVEARADTLPRAVALAALAALAKEGDA